MEWQPPHPRRLPADWEVRENLEQIRELDAKIAVISAQLAQLQGDRDTRLSFIATFRRIPPEILSEITRYAIDLGQAPLQLAQVCVPMRDAIHGIKQLWNTIVISERPRERGEVKGTITCTNRDWLQTLLNRSDPLPLDIAVVSPDEIMNMLQDLAPVSKRIESLSITTQADLDLGDSTYDFEKLRQLSLLGSVSRRTETEPKFTKILDFLPPELNQSFKLFLYVPYRSAHEILEHPTFSNLVHAVIRAYDAPGSPSEMSILLLPKVKTLEIEPPSYLSILDLPSLENLCVRSTPFEGFDMVGDAATEHLVTLYMDDIPEGIYKLEICDTIISTRNFQPKVLPNLVSMRLFGQLDVRPADVAQIHASQLEEVILSGAWLSPDLEDDEEDLYAAFFDHDRLLGQCPIRRLYIKDVSLSSLTSSVLMDATVLPGLSYLDISTDARRYGVVSLEDVRSSFSNSRPAVQLVLSDSL